MKKAEAEMLIIGVGLLVVILSILFLEGIWMILGVVVGTSIVALFQSLATVVSTGRGR